MLYAILWFVMLCLVALWSLGAWAFHAVAAWSTANAGALAGQVGAIDAWALPAWLSPWVPAEWMLALKAATATLGPAVGSLMEHAPAWMDGLSWAIWALWGLGCVALLAVSGVLHAIVAGMRRSAALASPASGGH